MTVRNIFAAPLGCKKATDPQRALDTIASNYIVASDDSDSISLMPAKSDAQKVFNHSLCPYEFVETKKNPLQIPETLQTAVCSGKCDERCKAVTYVVCVLEQNENCEGALGLKTWSIRKKEITIGYQM